MDLNSLDLFFSLPMFGYGQWFISSDFPFTISLKFKSEKYMRIQFLDKSAQRWAVCDKDHVYHLINPEKVIKIVFFDDQSQKKIDGSDLLEVLQKVQQKVKMNISYTSSIDWPNNRYVNVLIDNKNEHRFERSSSGKCYFSELIDYFEHFVLK